MKHLVVLALASVLMGGVASAGLSMHSHTFTLQNTGTGVSDARLRFAIDDLAVPGEDYFIDNISLKCGGGEILANGDFGGGLAPWKFYTNAPAPKPTLAIVDGEAVISFGSDGSNTQLYQPFLVLPGAGVMCTLTFDACSTGGPGDPGFGHNLSVKLLKHTSPYTNYGLDLDGAPPSPDPDVDLMSCSAGPAPYDPDDFPYAEIASTTFAPAFVNSFINFPTPPGFLYYIEQASLTCVTSSSTDVFPQALLTVTKIPAPNSVQLIPSPVVVLELRGPAFLGGFLWSGSAKVDLVSESSPFDPTGGGGINFNIFHTDASVTPVCTATLFGHTQPL